MIRKLLVASATLMLLAAPALAVVKTYNVDSDGSTRFPTDRTIYRGDCDPHAATPNAGDPTDDICACNPTIPLNLPGGCGEGVVAFLAGSPINSACTANLTPFSCCTGFGTGTCVPTPNPACSSTATPGRPNGGTCDPTIPNGPGANGFCFGSGTWRGSPCQVGSEASNCPAQNNSSCTAPGTPYLCCTGVATGTCTNTQGVCRTGGCLLGKKIKSSNASCGVTLPTAKAVITDTGNGSPTLTSITLHAAFTDVVGGTSTTGIPGTTVYLDNLITIGPAPNQVGSGSSTTSINFGLLSGWAQTGRLGCTTFCPPGGVCKVSACTPFGVLAGTGPLAALKSSAFNLDPWTFAGGGTSFSTGSVETTFLPATGPGAGSVRASLLLGGRLITIPALPLAGVAGLGAGLVYLGARALRRKED